MARLLSRFRGRENLLERNGNGSARARVRGSSGRSVVRAQYVVTAAESAPCTCPEFCERDHENE